MKTVSEDSLSLVFAALADPTRRAILALLADGPKPAGELAKPFSITAPAITKHLKTLEKAGLVRVKANAQSRIRTLDSEPLKEAHDWISRYHGHWEERLDRLDSYIKTVLEKETTP